MSEIYQIADAVTAAINAANLPLLAADSVTAQRVYVPIPDLAKLTEPLVLVAAKLDNFELLSRDGNWEDVQIGVGVYFKIPAGTDPASSSANAVLDPLVQLCRSIANLDLPGAMAGDGQWYESKYSPLFDQNMLKSDNVFAGLVLMKFRQSP